MSTPAQAEMDEIHKQCEAWFQKVPVSEWDGVQVEHVYLAYQAGYSAGQKDKDAEIARLREALVDACNFRRALCANSDVESEGGPPDNWDEPLMRWNQTLAAKEPA